MLRSAAPRVQALGDDFELARDPAARSARLPSLAHEAARRALAAGAPVLVQVPRRGYVPSLACARCRAPARCAHCAGPLGISPAARARRRPDPRLPVVRAARRPPSTARTATAPSCAPPWWGSRARRRSSPGPSRGRRCARPAARPGVLATVPGGPALVVATPGAEPVAEGGYGAALLLDSWALLGRADLRAGEETLRRWMNAAALVRPASAGGQVVVAADAAHPVVQALVRWDPAWLAERELADRRELGFPPVTRIAALSGSPAALAEFLEALRLPEDADLLGPVPEPPAPGSGGRARALPGPGAARRGGALAHALTEVQGVRSAKKAPEHVRVQLDPLDLVLTPLPELIIVIVAAPGGPAVSTSTQTMIN